MIDCLSQLGFDLENDLHAFRRQCCLGQYRLRLLRGSQWSRHHADRRVAVRTIRSIRSSRARSESSR
jgi:hypothetical protein